jgi:CRP/FNR family transcriptional regulator, cyclic AMP receptor protein
MLNRPSRSEQRQLLKNHMLFSRLGDDELSEVLAHAQIDQYAAGQEIFAKGSPGQSMMAVLRGSVKMSALSPDGREVVFSTMEAGEIFGEITLLDGGERSADATALTDCELLVLYRRDLLPFLRRHVDICIMLLELLCQRLRHTSEQVEDVSFVTLGSRVAKLLLHLAHREDGTGQPAVRVTQQELGHMVGGARESVNRQLQAWQKAGLIEVHKGSIAIRDIGGLRRIV